VGLTITNWAFVITIVAVGVVVTTLAACAGALSEETALSPSRKLWRSIFRVGSVFAVARVSILWFLTYLNWTGRETLSELPLMLLLCPEALVLSKPVSTSAFHVWLFSALLTIGSFAFVAAVGLLSAAVCRFGAFDFINGDALSIRAFGVWFVLVAAKFIHYVLQTILVMPVFGYLRARLIGDFTEAILILAVAYVFIQWLNANNKRSLLQVGALWLVLTLILKFTFGHFVFGRSWVNLASDYNILGAGLLPIGLVILTFSPLIAARLHGLRS